MKISLSFTVNIFIFFAFLFINEGIKEEFQTSQKKITGPVTALGQGTVQSFLKFDENGGIKMIGVVISESALKHLPKKRELIEVQIPQKMVQLPFDHIIIGWEPMVYGREGIFSDSYFDVHFNMLTSVERSQIVENDPLSDRLPDSTFMPANFVPAKGSVAIVGKRWLNPVSPEMHKSEMAYTLLMHSYNKKVVSYTPVFTLNYLKKNDTKAIDLPLPKAYQKTGKYYPTQYSIAYDAGKKEYYVILMGFKKNK